MSTSAIELKHINNRSHYGRFVHLTNTERHTPHTQILPWFKYLYLVFLYFCIFHLEGTLEQENSTWPTKS